MIKNFILTVLTIDLNSPYIKHGSWILMTIIFLIVFGYFNSNKSRGIDSLSNGIFTIFCYLISWIIWLIIY